MDGRYRVASRIVCEEANGSPPTPKHEAAHNCGFGDRGCVNPEHLQWKTHAGNQMDRVEHGTHHRGERQWMAKLTIPDVRQIRKLRGEISQSKIAIMFGVSQATVADIHLRRKWAWLP
ncbi:HNH endonuclease [Chelativorans xinjiangense]|uniref:HNH endonuclease n=1 Tax=Chelativorans xinjiangense TaxID=2681485 RepID=UPI003CCC8FB3